jgi:hypothetical protein
MWVLLFIAFGLQSIGGPVIITTLPKSDDQPLYETVEECQKEVDRIDAAMIESYAGQEKDWKLECKEVSKKVI